MRDSSAEMCITHPGRVFLTPPPPPPPRFRCLFRFLACTADIGGKYVPTVWTNVPNHVDFRRTVHGGYVVLWGEAGKLCPLLDVCCISYPELNRLHGFVETSRAADVFLVWRSFLHMRENVLCRKRRAPDRYVPGVGISYPPKHSFSLWHMRQAAEQMYVFVVHWCTWYLVHYIQKKFGPFTNSARGTYIYQYVYWLKKNRQQLWDRDFVETHVFASWVWYFGHLEWFLFSIFFAVFETTYVFTWQSVHVCITVSRSWSPLFSPRLPACVRSVGCPGGVGHQGLPADLHLHRLAHSRPLPAQPHHHAWLLLSFHAPLL